MFAYVCNPNAIEIVAKGRVWPAALNYSNLKKVKRSEGKKKSKASYSTQKTFQQESALAKEGHAW